MPSYTKRRIEMNNYSQFLAAPNSAICAEVTFCSYSTCKDAYGVRSTWYTSHAEQLHPGMPLPAPRRMCSSL
jgi:hypothetical protein